MYSGYLKLNIYEENVKLFGKVFGNILNVLIILIYMVMLTMAIRAIVIFVTSKYLQDTPFFITRLSKNDDIAYS